MLLKFARTFSVCCAIPNWHGPQPARTVLPRNHLLPRQIRFLEAASRHRRSIPFPPENNLGCHPHPSCSRPCGALLAPHQLSKLTKTDPVVLGDFVNKTGDPVFDDTLKQALSVSLAQSPFLNILSDQRVRSTLNLWGDRKAMLSLQIRLAKSASAPLVPPFSPAQSPRWDPSTSSA